MSKISVLCENWTPHSTNFHVRSKQSTIFICLCLRLLEACSFHVSRRCSLRPLHLQVCVWYCLCRGFPSQNYLRMGWGRNQLGCLCMGLTEIELGSANSLVFCSTCDYFSTFVSSADDWGCYYYFNHFQQCFLNLFLLDGWASVPLGTQSIYWTPE